MPASSNHTGVPEISAAKATNPPTFTPSARLMPNGGCPAIILRFNPDWLAFPMGALTFNPAYG